MDPKGVVGLALLRGVLLEAILSATVFWTGQFDGHKRREDDLKLLLEPHLKTVMARLKALDHDYARRAAKTLEFAWQGLTADISNPEPFWAMRESYFSWLAESNGDPTPRGRDPFRGRNIPHWLNSLIVSGATLLDVQAEVASLRKRKPPDESRRVARRALEEELTTGSNQAAIRIGLLHCLVDIDTDDSAWDDAIAHTTAIHELQDSLPTAAPLTPSQRIDREQTLAKLYDLSGAAATTQHLLTTLLRRVNTLTTSNPSLAARTLLALSTLTLTRRLDAPFSAIYLLARVLLTLARHGSGDTAALTLELFTATMRLTNYTQPQWMLGPADSRPQSVAIFFLGTILGQIVFPTFGGKATAGLLS